MVERDAAPQSKTRVFISYSRKDQPFVTYLAAALSIRGFFVDYDLGGDSDKIEGGLAPTDDWWRRLTENIAAADVVVFVVSPDSAASLVCDQEIGEAQRLGKRLIPILRSPINFAGAPQRLAALNVAISFASDIDPSDSDFTMALDQLARTINTDIDWLREGSRLTALAAKWERDGHPVDHLLRTGAISAAERWAARRPAGASPPAAMLLAYLEASRIQDEEERRRLRRVTGRAFVNPVDQALQEDRLDDALRLAAAGCVLADDPDFQLVPELWRLAARAIFDGRLRVALEGSTRSACFSPDGTRILTTSGKTALLWNATTGAALLAFSGHEDDVESASFSPDGRRILTTSLDFTTRIWDAERAAILMSLTADEQWVRSAVFSPDGENVITGSDDGIVRLWDTRTGAALAIFPRHTFSVRKMAFSQDGTRIVTVDGNRVRISDAITIAEIANIAHGDQQSILSVAISPDGDRIVTASDDGTARLWNSTTGAPILTHSGHAGAVLAASFSPDGKQVVTASEDHTAQVWNSASGATVATLSGHSAGVANAMFSPDGTRVATVSRDGTARLWGAATGSAFAILKAYEPVVDASFSPDGRRVLTRSHFSTRLWDAATGSVLQIRQPDKSDAILAASEMQNWRGERLWRSADGTRCVMALPCKHAELCNPATGEPIAKLAEHEEPVQHVWFSADGRYLITADSPQRWDAKGMALLRNAATGKVLASLGGHKGPVEHAWFNSDATRVVTASNESAARLWDTATGEMIGSLGGHEGRVECAWFSPDGSRVLTASRDPAASAIPPPGYGEIPFRYLASPGAREQIFSPENRMRPRLWDTRTGAAVATLAGHQDIIRDLLFSRDGRHFLTLSDDYTAKLWETASGALLITLAGHLGAVLSASFSPDCTRIVTASHDTTARVWDASSGACLAVLMGHAGSVRGASFSPNGCQIVTAADDGTVRLWEAEGGVVLSSHSHAASVKSAEFSPDGTCVIIVAADKPTALWDVSRAATFTSDRAVLLTAALANGVGNLALGQKMLIVEDAPNDLYAAMVRLIPERLDAVRKAVGALAAPLDPSCDVSVASRGQTADAPEGGDESSVALPSHTLSSGSETEKEIRPLGDDANSLWVSLGSKPYASGWLALVTWIVVALAIIAVLWRTDALR